MIEKYLKDNNIKTYNSNRNFYVHYVHEQLVPINIYRKLSCTVHAVHEILLLVLLLLHSYVHNRHFFLMNITNMVVKNE